MAPADRGPCASADSSPSSSTNSSSDEGEDGYKKGGYHPVSVGEGYADGRYVVVKKLGWGHFSTCWACEDTRGAQRGALKALKIQKSSGSYTEAARDEIEILNQVKDTDAAYADESKHVVTLYDSFTHEGPNGTHVCMVFDVLGDNLLTLIKRYDYLGVPLVGVRALTKTMLKGLRYLHGVK